MNNHWHIGRHHRIALQGKALIMGILNVTPDSFSDGGSYTSLHKAVERSLQMVEEGASIIDIGGESTRPGFEPLTSEEERVRVLPVIEALHNRTTAHLSIDTYHSETARHAIDAGVDIVNDIWGLQREPEMAEIVADKGAGVIIMHNSRDREILPDLIEDQKFFFEKSLTIATKAGIGEASIMLDPGIGFGKNLHDNLILIRRAKELTSLGFPLLAATSRKRFLGTISGHEEPKGRDVATAATSILLRQAGFSVFRVHDVAINKDALAIVDAINGQDLNS